MIEQFIYKNHLNETLHFGESGLYVNQSDLHDFKWDFKTKNKKISSFERGIATKTIPIVISSESEAEGIRIRNLLFELCEKDVLTGNHGRIILGDYYLKCFVTESNKKSYLPKKNNASIEVTITTDFPGWVKETTTTFGYGVVSVGTNKDYNNDYPMDYTSNILGTQLVNTDFVPTNFRMTIYGAAVNPEVTIGGHIYKVNVSLEAGDYLIINSSEKTITKCAANGTKTNCFNNRDRESYIFEKIPSGTSNVSKNGNFKFDITLLEERSEPKWT